MLFSVEPPPSPFLSPFSQAPPPARRPRPRHVRVPCPTRRLPTVNARPRQRCRTHRASPSESARGSKQPQDSLLRGSEAGTHANLRCPSNGRVLRMRLLPRAGTRPPRRSRRVRLLRRARPDTGRTHRVGTCRRSVDLRPYLQGMDRRRRWLHRCARKALSRSSMRRTLTRVQPHGGRHAQPLPGSR